MPTFDTINYSLRPNKAIQRHIVFDCLEQLDRCLPLKSALYIGFGSIWFSDFVLAHKRLGISSMISIEREEIGAIRGRFNAPFKTVSVEHGDSTPILDDIRTRADALAKQWVVWLDYDRSATETTLEDIRIIVTHAPPNSVLIVTLDAGGLGMGRSKREQYLRNLLGDAIPEDLDDIDFEVENIPRTLAQGVLDHIGAEAINLGRPGGFVQAINVAYSDSVNMITIGGVLSAPAARGAVRACIEDSDWPGFPASPAAAPPLTLKEVTALQRLLPSDRGITRAKLRRIGFDLLDEQLAAYVEHYRRYPTFMQVVG